MWPMTSQIEIYQEMSALSTNMVEAARIGNWERLVELEQSVARLRISLGTDDDNSRLSPSELDLKRLLIQRILDDDAEIRRYTEPWMEQVRQLLGGAVRRKQVEQAYSVST